MKVLVIGASGTVGSAITKKLRAEGHEVIAVSRKTTPSVDIEKTDEPEIFLEEMDPVDHIVCTGGAVQFAEGPLHTLTDAAMYRGIDSKLMGQVKVARFGHGSINEGGSILLTGGLVAYRPLFCQRGPQRIRHFHRKRPEGLGVPPQRDPPAPDQGNRHRGVRRDGQRAPVGGRSGRRVLPIAFEDSGTGQEYFIPGFDGKA